jgi:hypothetical protein
MFKPGDKVRVKLNSLSNLDKHKIYEISEATPYHNEITIKDFPGIHNISIFDKVEEKPNYVDVGMIKTASKNDQNKVDLSLIPKISMIEHAKAFMVGEKKYGRYNYTKGHKASQLVAAAMRHLTAWNEREETDPVDGQHHLGSVMACCSMILRQMELGTLKDDRYENNKE